MRSHKEGEYMIRYLLLSFILTAPFQAFAQAEKKQEFPPDTKMAPARLVKLIVDKDHYTEINYPARPVVVDGLINMIPGEEIFIEAEVSGDKLVNLKWVDTVKNPDRTIKLSFSQSDDKESPMMMLNITNPFDRDLVYEAGIQVYGRQKFSKTSALPIAAKLGAYEMWPDTITRILLKNFHFKKQ